MCGVKCYPAPSSMFHPIFNSLFEEPTGRVMPPPPSKANLWKSCPAQEMPATTSNSIDFEHSFMKTRSPLTALWMRF